MLQYLTPILKCIVRCHEKKRRHPVLTLARLSAERGSHLWRKAGPNRSRVHRRAKAACAGRGRLTCLNSVTGRHASAAGHRASSAEPVAASAVPPSPAVGRAVPPPSSVDVAGLRSAKKQGDTKKRWRRLSSRAVVH
jgi:hypothetical protein